jgi:hypothetical protein
MRTSNMSNMDTDMQVYVDALNSPPNGWGQHIIEPYGQSHHYLRYLNVKHGIEQVEAWLDAYYDHYRSTVQ